MKLTFIGGGNMASALIGGMLRKGWPAEALRVVDVEPAAREKAARIFGVDVCAEPAAGAAGADCVLLAVKPQQMQQVARALAPHVKSALVLTIAAGIRTTDLRRWLGGHQRIVRAMPNTPALVLSGVSGLYADQGATEADRASAEQILGVAGRTLWVDTEEKLDAVTAVSGSGPAYVFYFIEALEAAARDLGFGDEDAGALALETFAGAVKLAIESNENVATLRQRVTSKRGTTERAIETMEHDAVREAVIRAVRSAAARSRELGAELGRDEVSA
jgi:pyrroline-5-carboxylate reductase